MGRITRTSIFIDRILKKRNPTALLILSIFSLYSTQIELKRGDGTPLICYADRPNVDAFPITLILPSCQRESSKRMHDALKEQLLKMNHAVLTIEKQSWDRPSEAFLEGICLTNRLKDHLLVLKQIEEGLIPGWNGKIAIVGQGDGGRIGSRLAKLFKAKALILVASGGAWPPLQEALYSFRHELVEEGFSPDYIHGFVVGAKREFAQALETPTIKRKAFGHTYQYWNSLAQFSLVDDLSHVDCPIYFVAAEKDSLTPIESVETLMKHLDQKVTYQKELGGREIIQNPNIYSKSFSWLGKKL